MQKVKFMSLKIGDLFKFNDNLYIKCGNVAVYDYNSLFIGNALCLQKNNPETYVKYGKFISLHEDTFVYSVDESIEHYLNTNNNENLKFKHLKTGETFITMGHKNPGEEFLYEKIEIIGRPENTLNLIDMTIFQTLDDTEVIRYDD